MTDWSVWSDQSDDSAEDRPESAEKGISVGKRKKTGCEPQIDRIAALYERVAYEGVIELSKKCSGSDRKREQAEKPHPSTPKPLEDQNEPSVSKQAKKSKEETWALPSDSDSDSKESSIVPFKGRKGLTFSRRRLPIARRGKVVGRMDNVLKHLNLAPMPDMSSSSRSLPVLALPEEKVEMKLLVEPTGKVPGSQRES
eukprot:m.1515 g.1515  ORF g.1515 m.1515 type:complete len:198 (+) comp7011_c0_seq2:50-643(+)